VWQVVVHNVFHWAARQPSKATPKILQLNTGKLCNITCTHCHVNAGPGRKELISKEHLTRTLDWLEQTDIPDRWHA